MPITFDNKKELNNEYKVTPVPVPVSVPVPAQTEFKSLKEMKSAVNKLQEDLKVVKSDTTKAAIESEIKRINDLFKSYVEYFVNADLDRIMPKDVQVASYDIEIKRPMYPIYDFGKVEPSFIPGRREYLVKSDLKVNDNYVTVTCITTDPVCAKPQGGFDYLKKLFNGRA